MNYLALQFVNGLGIDVSSIGLACSRTLLLLAYSISPTNVNRTKVPTKLVPTPKTHTSLKKIFVDSMYKSLYLGKLS